MDTNDCEILPGAPCYHWSVTTIGILSLVDVFVTFLAKYHIAWFTIGNCMS